MAGKMAINSSVNGTATSTTSDPISGFSSSLDVVDKLVLGWLVRNGHQATFNKMPSAHSYHDDPNSFTLPQRALLKKLIREGDILSAIELTRTHFPQLMRKASTSPAILLTPSNFFAGPLTPHQSYFWLLCQQFIELLRRKDLPAALAWVQNELVPLSLQDSSLVSIQNEVIGLLVYAEPSASPLAHLLHPQPRLSHLANLLNASLLAPNPAYIPDHISPLEGLLRHLLALDQLIDESACLVDEIDTKRWATLQDLFAGTQIKTAHSQKFHKVEIKLIKND